MISGGVMGASTAYYLTKAELKDVVLLDLARFDEGRLIHEYNVVQLTNNACKTACRVLAGSFD